MREAERLFIWGLLFGLMGDSVKLQHPEGDLASIVAGLFAIASLVYLGRGVIAFLKDPAHDDT